MAEESKKLNKWSQPANPPPPMFLGKKERDYVKQVNDEIIERVVGQAIIYYPISELYSNFHPLYGEAIEKTFLPPVRVHALVNWEGSETSTTNYGIDNDSRIVVNFHKRRLNEDQDLFAREGDIVFYGSRFYEIVKLSQPRELFGQAAHRFEVSATCIRAREGLFDEPTEIAQARERVRVLAPETPEDVEDAISSGCGGKIAILAGSTPGSVDYETLEDMNDNPTNYRGCIVYVTSLVTDTTFGEFPIAQKFYFNEDGIWHKSPFIVC